MDTFWLSVLGLFALAALPAAPLQVGIAMSDITGPAAEITFMGYAKADQKGMGLHLRQFARAYILDDGNQRLVFVSADVAMMGHGVRMEILKNLKKKFGPDLYTEENVMISGTHTHSAPGGFMRDLLFDLPVFGFVQETYTALIDGITQAIVKAHNNMVEAKMYYTKGILLDSNINRSPTAYMANPPEERERYEHNVDKDMVQVRFISVADERPLGAIHWFAVHPTSMNLTNRLISSDNVGYAAILFENRMNNGALPGTGSFVSAFASTNLGDVSPNIRGPRCMNTGLECDIASSACEGHKNQCVASGPGKDMFDSTRIIAERMATKAAELWEQEAREITGPLKVVHQYVHMPSQKAIYKNPFSGEEHVVHGCNAAMGYSFAAGTTDGPGEFNFVQGTTTDNPLWNMVRDFLSKPSQQQINCQGAKPILLNTGEMSFPYEWQPSIVPCQLAMWGSDLFVAGVPGEFTTMSGRRLRESIRKAVADAGGSAEADVVVAGLSNIYSDYIVTPEEYSVQRYEGASTIYGPHTLTIYLSRYSEMAKAMIENSTVDPGPSPKEIKNVLSLVPPVIFDVPGWRREFGDCVLQPAKVVRPGDTVVAKFAAGHPRNNNMHGKTFLTVERNDGDDWTIIATDANWETKFIWTRGSKLSASSEVTIEWDVGTQVEPGEYRIRHFGYYKYILGGIYPYDGVTNTFKVI